jgi:hypothetical protein
LEFQVANAAIGSLSLRACLEVALPTQPRCLWERADQLSFKEEPNLL